MHPVKEYQDITLTVEGLNWVRFVTPTRRWMSNNYITQVKTGRQSVGEKLLEWGTCLREAGTPGPRLGSPGERERNAVMAIEWGSICCSSVQLPTHLSHSKTFSNPFEPFQIKWEVYFSKELCRSSLLCRRYDSACICIRVCIVVYGYTTVHINDLRSFLFIIGVILT